jgi:hypothetical protein
VRDAPGADAGRAFGPAGPRFRRFAEAAVAGSGPVQDNPLQLQPATVPLAEEPGEAIAAKPFIGPHATFYDDRWRWMDWRGRSHGWNWPAATTCGVWLAYRKMYRWAVIYLAAFGLLVLLAVSGVPLRLLISLFAAGNLILGTYANTLYYQHFRSVARVVGNHHADYRTTAAALATAGGVDPAGARWMVASLVGVTGVALSLAVLTGSLHVVF